MSNKLTVTTSDGVYAVGTKAFLTVDGVHRKVKKMFRTTDGVHRLCYQFGIEWKKYSCNYSEGYSQYTGTLSGTSSMPLSAISNVTWYDSYGFSSDNGFYGVGPNTGVSNPEVIANARCHFVTATSVDKVTSYDDTYIYLEEVGRANGTFSYSKGDTEYGSVYAEEGTLPEDGTCVNGSATGTSCVLQIDGTYYYYEKV